MSFGSKMLTGFKIHDTNPKTASGSVPIDDDDRKEARIDLGIDKNTPNKAAEDEWFERQGVQYLTSKGVTATCTVSGDRLKPAAAGNDGSLTQHHTGVDP